MCTCMCIGARMHIFYDSSGCTFKGTKTEKDQHEADCPLKESGLQNAVEMLSEKVRECHLAASLV